MRIRRLCTAAMIGALAGVALAGMVSAGNALHIRERPMPDAAEADAVAGGSGSAWESVRARADDGVLLDAWLFVPRAPNGSAVLLLHGVGDTRVGMLGHARFLLRDGFTVLLPDSRGHGVSGGALVTYGVKEAGDVRCWVDLLVQGRGVQRVYGLGESLGAAILLQSLAVEPRFRAVVADCPFASFEEIAYDRLAEASGGPRWMFWPVVQVGFLYTRARYGVDLRQASPAATVRSTNIPILLIHGTRDSKTAVRHSRELHAMNPGATELWEVPGAGHVESFAARPHEYMNRVTDWFQSHP